MLIHEIFRKSAINEAFPVKGMQARPRDARGRYVGPGASVFSNMAQQLTQPRATVPTTSTALATTPQATLPATATGTAVAPATQGTLPAATTGTAVSPTTARRSQSATAQSDPNVIDVDAKDITNRPTLAAPSVPRSSEVVKNPNVKPGGSKEAQAWRAQQAAQKTAPAAPAAAPAASSAAAQPTAISKSPVAPKAGFIRNAAEYYANKMLQQAGVPGSEVKDMKMSPGGHLAASLGQGSATLAKTQNDMAERLAREYYRYKTLNGERVQGAEPTQAEITQAIELANRAGPRLSININTALNRFNQFRAQLDQQKAAATTARARPTAPAAPAATPTPAAGAAPAATGLSYPGGQPILPGDPVYAALKQQGKI